ncbi:hypothetical protein [Nonomuraea jabiensis]|uniref:hypothetical protein n=1 Tax=Nonomuraea jabiensis TaxID=882448 RepID=UPI0036750B8A
MPITVPDTCSTMRRILRAPGTDRVDLLRSMPERARGMYRGEVDLVAMHFEASGFPIDRDEEPCLDAALRSLGAA